VKRRAFGVFLCFWGFGCGPRPVADVSFDHDPVSELDVEDGERGRWVGVMRGAYPSDVAELASGDLLVAGQAASSFVQRVGEDGDERWTFSFVGCDHPRLAVASDDELYVAVHGFIGLGEGTREARRQRRAHCSRQTRAPVTILRLNGSGEVLWRRTVAPDGLGAPALFAEPGRLLVLANRGTQPATTTLVEFANDGRKRSTRDAPGTFGLAVWSPESRTLLDVQGGGSGSPCVVRAFDSTSGELRYRRTLGPAEPPNGCVVRQLAVTSKGALVSTSYPEQRLYGLEPATGAPTFELGRETYPSSWHPAFTGRISPELAPLLEYWLDPARGGVQAVVVGVDPRTGQGFPLARFGEPASRVMDDTPGVTHAGWGPRSLVVTGSFHAGMALGDVEVETSPVSRTRCQSIDPGFSIGPAPEPPPPRFEPGPWRGPRRRVCPPLTFPARVHAYKTSLFVARLPVASFDAAPR
jgi:hypothetical protein